MSRLTDEQEVTRYRGPSPDSPEDREASIQRLIAKYERLGARGHQGPSRPLAIRDEAEMERRRARDAQALAMRRAGMLLKDIAPAMGMGKTSAHDAIKRAEEQERRANEREAA